MRKYVILAVILTTTILSYFYFQLGGVSDIRKQVVTVDSYQLIAQSFKGKYNSSKLEEIFYGAKKLGNLLVIINYSLQGDSTEQGFVHQMIGVQTEKIPTDIPAGFHQETIAKTKTVQAIIDAHNLVMPKPNEIEEVLRTYGKEQNLLLAGYTIERYLSDRELIVEIPIIE